MKGTKEAKIDSIICELAPFFQSAQMQIIENVLINQLYDVEVSNKSTEIATYVDDNEYMINLFQANKRLENLSGRSIEQYVYAIRMFLNTVNKNYRDITTNDVKYYLAMYQKERHVCINTIVNTKRFISAFFSWAHIEEYINRNPVLAVKIKPVEKKKEYLNNEEIETMRENCKTLREKALFEFLLSTGLRVSEVVGLKIEDVNFKEMEVIVYATKTRKYRTVYLNTKAKRALLKYIGDRTVGSVFASVHNPFNGLGKSSIQHIIQAVASRAGITKHVTVHLFRKTFATILKRNGCDITIIKELLGHADIGVTEKHYMSIEMEDIKMEHKRCAA